MSVNYANQKKILEAFLKDETESAVRKWAKARIEELEQSIAEAKWLEERGW